MKNVFFAILISLSIVGYSQPKSELNGIKTIYKNKIFESKQPAFFINGKLVYESYFKTLNPNEIENINIEKDEITIDNTKYFGKIIIKTKTSYNPQLITLNDLKLKYTSVSKNPTIFKIDHETINADYEIFLVDENNILSINVEEFVNTFENIKINIINIITKSEENLKKSKEIRICCEVDLK